ncbi:hypothetical protein BpHYR1_014863, partial [Brachionus plicatilis]
MDCIWNNGGVWGDKTEWRYFSKKRFICGLLTQ